MLVCLKYDLQEPLALHDLTRARHWYVRQNF